MIAKAKKVPELKLEGRSGCDLNIFSKNGIHVVRKSSVSQSYSERLSKQAKKQAMYKSASELAFSAPKVLEEGEISDGIYYFDMEYVHGEKFSDFLSRATKTEINNLYNLFESYFDSLFNNAVEKEVDFKIVENKINDVERKLIHNNFYSNNFKESIIDKLRNDIPKNQLALGDCHGDFTFSNILFGGEKVFIFDFLDSFIESPLIDIVKIRQDTKFYWSIEIDTNLDTSKRGRVIQVMQYLDNKFAKYINTKWPQYTQWYNYLELFNLVRIMPYANDIRDVHFLQKNLQKLIS